MPRRRVGVALLVPPPFDREIDGLRRALDDGALGRMPPHLTLVPPVNVREERLGEALRVLRSAARHAAPLQVVLGPPASFLPATPVVYLPVGGPGLEGVHRLRHAAFTGVLERKLTWPFEPHVTLVDEATPERILAALHALAGYAIAVTFERLHLLEEGRGRVWRPVADFSLGPPAVIGRGGLEVELTMSERPDAQAGAASAWPCQAQPAESIAITARREGAVVGAAAGWVGGRTAILSELVVGEDQRRQGIGSHLLARFLAEAAGRGAGAVRLRVTEGSHGELFFRSRGFVGEADPDALVLVRRLGPS